MSRSQEPWPEPVQQDWGGWNQSSHLSLGILGFDDYVRARACVNLCAGTSDAALKDIADAFKAYGTNLGQFMLDGDSKNMRMIGLLVQARELMVESLAIIDENTQLKAEIHRLNTALDNCTGGSLTSCGCNFNSGAS